MPEYVHLREAQLRKQCLDRRDDERTDDGRIPHNR
jgi:hypothetical protein